jgi:hypothetical protein
MGRAPEESERTRRSRLVLLVDERLDVDPTDPAGGDLLHLSEDSGVVELDELDLDRSAASHV